MDSTLTRNTFGIRKVYFILQLLGEGFLFFGAILLNSFTNIVKTNLVKITLFKLKFSIYKQMEMSDFTHSVKSSPRCRHFHKNEKNTQLPSCIARPVAIRLLGINFAGGQPNQQPTLDHYYKKCICESPSGR
jgi:hypothetical protein